MSFLQNYGRAGKITSSNVSEDEELQEQNEEVTQPALKWRKLNDNCQEMKSHTSGAANEYVEPVRMITTDAATITSLAGSGGVVQRVVAKRTSFLPSFRKRKTTSLVSPESSSTRPQSSDVPLGVTVAALQPTSVGHWSSPVRAMVGRSSLASASSRRDQGTPKKSVTFAKEAIMTSTAGPVSVRSATTTTSLPPKEIFLNGPRVSKLLRRLVARHTPLPTVNADDLGCV